MFACCPHPLAPSAPSPFTPAPNACPCFSPHPRHAPGSPSHLTPAYAPLQAQDQVTSARFYAIKHVAQDVDSLSDAQMEFAAHASSVLASLGLDQAAQQLRQSNAAAAEKLAAVKQQQAGLDLSGLLEDRLPGLLPGEGAAALRERLQAE
ncbi:hypothetical protein QJQ45_029097 [Haematococcus lacustris]|nr:hypothetical protein QJQ45_029097 [Haematococcus lacustris]